MKSKKIVYLEKVLRFMSGVVLRKYNPKVVGITGSVGKTSAKEAIFLVLNDSFDVRSNEKNYNNEIGLPLTIIGAKSGNSSIFGWLKVLVKWLWVITFPVKYPEILVLEMGVDNPGDMDYLRSFIPVDVAVITNISNSHLEQFKTIEKIAKEKFKIAKDLSRDGLVVLNIDNHQVQEMYRNKYKNNSNVFLFGFTDESEVRAVDVNFSYRNEDFSGINFKLQYEGKIIPVWLPNIVARHHIYAALAGVCVGVYFKISLMDISKSLEMFSSPVGRMNLMGGYRGSVLIDDTYNASKVSTLAALEVLSEIKSRRKIAVLGDMLELGDQSLDEHKEVIKKALKLGVLLYVVGESMILAAEQVLLSDRFSQFRGSVSLNSNPVDAGEEVKEILDFGDVVLVKGSQSMRMEKAVEVIMEKPFEAEKLLCRQDKVWKSRPFIR